MTADAAKSAVAAINRHMQHARALLVDLYEQRGWVALGYSSWRECVLSEFDASESALYNALTAGQIERTLAPLFQDSTKIVPESQLLALKSLPPTAQQVAWGVANQTARDQGERLTTRHIAAAVRDYTPDTRLPEQKTEDMTDRPTRFTTGMRSSDSNEWFTPERILAPVRAVLGGIDLDPCSNETAQRDVQALRYYTEADDGLAQSWQSDTLFMNPPYGRSIGAWTDRLIRAYTSGEAREAIALLPGRTDTDWFTPLFAYPICFVHGRLTFSGYTAGAPFPSVVLYFGADLARFTHAFAPIGPIMLPFGPSHKAAYNPLDIRTPGHAAHTLVTA
jgi:site-specific DNA-methyltransferase (adenine-specific)